MPAELPPASAAGQRVLSLILARLPALGHAYEETCRTLHSDWKRTVEGWKHSLRRMHTGLSRAAPSARSMDTVRRSVPRMGQWLARVLRIPARQARSLVGDILLAQLLLASVVGLLAIGGLWVISNAVIEDNLRKWAVAWISELEDLGAPLYRQQIDDNERFVRIENYIANFPEIMLVRYYSASGEVLFGQSAHGGPRVDDVKLLSAQQLDTLRVIDSPDKPYLLDSTQEQHALFRVSAPVWVESIKPGQLLNFDLDAAPSDNIQLVGFVELGLDFSRYQNRLMTSIAAGSLALALALVPLALLGRHVLKRALRPLSELEKPLARLAAGETEVEVSSTGHKEIVAIHSALRTTIRALNDRDKRLRRLADYDPLTGLLNRRSFTQRLDEEIARVGGRRQNSSALLFVDLDQFKYVNDTLGHAAGDRVLIQAASCLHNSLRTQDLVARFGGDEFAILLKDIKAEEAQRIAAQLVQVMRDALFVEDGQSLNVLCSIGLTMIGAETFTSDELLSQADLACHESKSRGRNRYHCYEVSGREKRRMAADIGWSQKIKEALNNDSFVLHYQPIIQLNDGRASIYEVLLRMPGNKQGVIPPAAFMPAANRFGLMVEIDHMVIAKSIQALAEFRQRGHDIKLTMNLSGYVFDDPGLVQRIERHLQQNDLDPGMVIFEITEQVAVRHLAQARGLIQDIMQLGCRFALDDFGAGFSSFNYLKHLPSDFLKIDGGFIKNIANEPIDQAMVKSIIQIANAVGKQTIAEYVQDAPTLQILRDLGVDHAQGYYIGKPQGTLCSTPFPLALTASQTLQWREVQDEIIELAVGWHLRHKLSYRQLYDEMQKRGLAVSQTTVSRWVRRLAPQLRIKTHPENVEATAVQINEALVNIKGNDRYLYRAVDAQGVLCDFVLLERSDAAAAKRFMNARMWA